MKVDGYILNLRKQLEKIYSPDEARAIAFRVVGHVMSWETSKIYSSGDTILNNTQLEKLGALEQDLVSGRPLQYVLGFTEFAGQRIRVKEGCLIPRPETEQLYYLAADDAEKMMEGEEASEQFNILDICTGSGCLAYLFAAEFSGVQVYGCDLSDEALSIACKQRVKCCEGKPVFFKGDLLQNPPMGLPQFDLIISNPPYILEKEKGEMNRNVLDFEPSMALFVPDDDPLRFYKAIKEWSTVLLKPNGHIWLEVNENFAFEVAELFTEAIVLKDFNDKNRFVYVSKK